MHKKWMAKLGAPLLALALVSACGSTNNHNENIPKDTNIPENNPPDHEDIRYNDENFETPDGIHDNNREVPEENTNIKPNEAPENGFYDLPNRNG